MQINARIHRFPKNNKILKAFSPLLLIRSTGLSICTQKFPQVGNCQAWRAPWEGFHAFLSDIWHYLLPHALWLTTDGSESVTVPLNSSFAHGQNKWLLIPSRCPIIQFSDNSILERSSDFYYLICIANMWKSQGMNCINSPCGGSAVFVATCPWHGIGMAKCSWTH